MAEGYINLDRTTGVYTGITGITAKKCGQLVQLKFYDVDVTGGSSWTRIGTLPNTLWPLMGIFACGYDNSVNSWADDSVLQVRIDTDGKVFCYSFSDHNSYKLRSNICYLAN